MVARLYVDMEIHIASHRATKYLCYYGASFLPDEQCRLIEGGYAIADGLFFFKLKDIYLSFLHL